MQVSQDSISEINGYEYNVTFFVYLKKYDKIKNIEQPIHKMIRHI
jgi:hypothetical protein